MSYSTKSSTKKKSGKRIVERGIIRVFATFNNTIVTITDVLGNTLVAKSGGSDGKYKNSRKSTAHAAEIATKSAASIVKDKFGMKEVAIYFKGIGQGREILRYLNEFNFRVLFLRDVTPKAFNGPRPPKERRI